MSLSAALFFKMYGSRHQTNSELLKFLLYPSEIQIEQYKIAFETWKWSLKIQREITNFQTSIFCLISQLFFLIRKKGKTLYLFVPERIISKEEKKTCSPFLSAWIITTGVISGRFMLFYYNSKRKNHYYQTCDYLFFRSGNVWTVVSRKTI